MSASPDNHRLRTTRCLLAFTLMLLLGADLQAAPKSQRSKKARAAATNKKQTANGKRPTARGRKARRGRAIARSRRSRRGRLSRARVAAVVRPPGSTIPPERVVEIQNALIGAGYLSAPASGQYDEATLAAMKRFQTDRRLPATGLPSAMTLKLLGVPKNSSDGYSVPVKSAAETQTGKPKDSETKP